MKILIIGWSIPPKTTGGLDIYCSRLSAELSEKDDVYITIPEFNMPDTIPDIGNACVVPVKCKKTGSMLETVLGYNRNIIESFSDENFDIIHANDWFGVIAAHRLKEYKKVPFILAVHSTEYMRRGMDKRIKNDIDFIEDFGLKNADGIITVSFLMKNEIIKNYGIDEKKIIVVKNGFDVVKKSDSEFIKRKYSTGKNKIILYFGRLTRQKGVEYLIYASRQILKRYENVSIVIAGSGHNEGQLKKFVTCLGLEDKIIFAGYVSPEDANSYYNSSDIFVMPSVWEPFGIAMTEAMAHMIPVIATNRTGAAEGMKDGRDLIKIDAGNSGMLADVLIRLLDDEKLSIEIGRNGFRFCKENYSWKKCASDTRTVYGNVIQALNLNL
ncbi:MAG: glycosyltransferase family 4 protein [Candidatus Micrarchaeota archaeon]|nr:glycosyltransferase family 4 protein [Candidatus Micrarchaeota archaeon]